MVVQRRDGPRRLLDHDDNDDDFRIVPLQQAGNYPRVCDGRRTRGI